MNRARTSEGTIQAFNVMRIYVYGIQPLVNFHLEIVMGLMMFDVMAGAYDSFETVPSS